MKNHSSALTSLLSKRIIWIGDPDSDALSQWAPQSYTFTKNRKDLDNKNNKKNNNDALYDSLTISFCIPEIDDALPHAGLQRGALHEFIYNDPLQPTATPTTLTTILAYNAHAGVCLSLHGTSWDRNFDTHHHTSSTLSTVPSIAWIGKRCWPNPYALESLPSPHESPHIRSFLSHSLFIDTANDSRTVWAIETALRSKAIHTVVADCPSISLATTQRLARISRNSGTTALLLRATSDRAAPSLAHSRWELTPTPSLTHLPSWCLTLHKLRGAAIKNSSWVIRLEEHCVGLTKHTHEQKHALVAHASAASGSDVGENSYILKATRTGTRRNA